MPSMDSAGHQHGMVVGRADHESVPTAPSARQEEAMATSAGHVTIVSKHRVLADRQCSQTVNTFSGKLKGAGLRTWYRVMGRLISDSMKVTSALTCLIYLARFGAAFSEDLSFAERLHSTSHAVDTRVLADTCADSVAIDSNVKQGDGSDASNTAFVWGMRSKAMESVDTYSHVCIYDMNYFELTCSRKTTFPFTRLASCGTRDVYKCTATNVFDGISQCVLYELREGNYCHWVQSQEINSQRHWVIYERLPCSSTTAQAMAVSPESRSYLRITDVDPGAWKYVTASTSVNMLSGDFIKFAPGLTQDGNAVEGICEDFVPLQSDEQALCIRDPYSIEHTNRGCCVGLEYHETAQPLVALVCVLCVVSLVFTMVLKILETVSTPRSFFLDGVPDDSYPVKNRRLARKFYQVSTALRNVPMVAISGFVKRMGEEGGFLFSSPHNREGYFHYMLWGMVPFQVGILACLLYVVEKLHIVRCSSKTEPSRDTTTSISYLPDGRAGVWHWLSAYMLLCSLVGLLLQTQLQFEFRYAFSFPNSLDLPDVAALLSVLSIAIDLALWAWETWGNGFEDSTLGV